MTFRDQHALITGGSSGIGLALARRLAAKGARISLVARDPQKLAAARQSILAQSPTSSVATAAADVAVQAEVLGALAACETVHGPVDLLVTCAGVCQPGYFDEVPVSVFERTMAVNYLGSVYPLKAVVPAMRKRRGGRILLVSSGAGLVGLFGYSPYSPSKFALRGLAEALRAELRPSGVTVTVVYPPDTDTPQLEQETRTKPAETRAITAGAGLWSADAVAQAALSGVERGRFAVTPGIPLTLLFWFQSLIAPLLAWNFDRMAARATKNSSAPR